VFLLKESEREENNVSSFNWESLYVGFKWCERERERKRKKGKEKERERERERWDLGNAGDCWREINERKEKAKLEFKKILKNLKV
jgi:hypothetical protein